ncbi:MAG: TrkA C-terminal domain-containing protein [Alphaproteobacteria bacterium]|nr:TrkA C-terminal domain-containing protein [Alphaproteobacteria bacterium]
MEIDVYALFQGSPALVVFVVVGFGYFLGKLNIRGFELGPTGGVLLVGLLFGHFGFEGIPLVGQIGFTIFIYSVGVQAGPRFFNVLREDGVKYISLALTVAVSSMIMLWLLANLFGLDNSLAAGILAGALTSTPTLVGAQNAVDVGLANLAEGVSRAQALQNISVGYAITYVFGTVGLILIVKFAPQILKLDLAKEAKRYAKEKGYQEADKRSAKGLPVVRGYQVEEGSEILGKTRAELEARREYNLALVRLKRGNKIIRLGLDDELAPGDMVAILAAPEVHADLRERTGVKWGILDSELLEGSITSADVIVTEDSVVGHPIRDLRAPEEHACFVTHVRRTQVELPAEGSTVLHKGDVITLVGNTEQLEKLAEMIGEIERDVVETDLVSFALGIAGGLLLGKISVKFGAVAVGIGSAGGLLLMGILMGFLRSLSPTFGRVPPAARFVLMELGLMFFMVNVGLSAGGGVVEALLSVGPVVILCGILVLLTPVVLGYLFGIFVLKLNAAVLLGSLTGAMTSTPALTAVQEAAKSSMPALGYAGTYAFANVLLTVAGTIIMTL